MLVVDDDTSVRDVVRRYLERAGYEVELAGDGETALQLHERHRPDLVVLDLMLPGVGGLDVCRRLRETSAVPVVLLTALGEESDRVLGLETGADDYVVKPFSPRELVLRVGSILRRAGASPPGAGETVSDGPLRLDLGARRGTLDGAELALTGREFDLLAFLLRNPGRAFSRAELLERVWGWSFGDHSTVTVHMRRLREKIEPDPARPARIATVWGVGYRYDPLEPS
ncbi:response regulator transcription factor [Saccharopolyspora taberi]|uniref:Response regulator transcription factor n=1 Tax=Saccharopolyspora taberi TaxID=60895 RepID=A0ABN3VEN4_9PSEU